MTTHFHNTHFLNLFFCGQGLGQWGWLHCFTLLFVLLIGKQEKRTLYYLVQSSQPLTLEKSKKKPQKPNPLPRCCFFTFFPEKNFHKYQGHYMEA